MSYVNRTVPRTRKLTLHATKAKKYQPLLLIICEMKTSERSVVTTEMYSEKNQELRKTLEPIRRGGHLGGVGRIMSE